ncbi:GNAT family N-acetyltransferase, partial [Serratia ureilytica]
MEIRAARLGDRHAIAELMTALGYPGTEAFLTQRMQQLLAHPDEALLVAADGAQVLGVLSLHFLPQLALAGD